MAMVKVKKNGSWVVSPIISGYKKDLLWTNSSPSSAFAGQTITIDLSGYDQVFVIANIHYTTPTYMASPIIFEVGGGGVISSTSGTAANVSGAPYFYARQITSTTSSITFGSGKSWRADQTATLSDNNACIIPYKIYGIKE